MLQQLGDDGVSAGRESSATNSPNRPGVVSTGHRAASIPHRERYLLNHRLAKRLLEAHLQWVDEVEAELG